MANWMSEVPGELLVSQLTIPGSHNSYCRYDIFTGLGWWGEDWAACQDKDNGIPEQLNSGIRFLDFRMENGGKIVHGIADTKGIFFSEVRCCLEHLEKHLRECILVSSKWEKQHVMGAMTQNNPMKYSGWLMN